MNPIRKFETPLFPSDDVSAERKLFKCFAEGSLKNNEKLTLLKYIKDKKFLYYFFI